MENIHGFDQRAQLINELLQGLEAIKQLRNQIENKTTFLSYDDDNNQALKCSSLIEKMMSTFDKTIIIANQIKPSNPNNNHVQLELPQSFAVKSPRSENSQPDLPASKRRKMMPRWTKTVQISPDKPVNGLEGPLNDGFSWRKYGQKGIFGTRFPRGYYRCTHRHSKDCRATKQVQQSDEDPSIYKVMYKGEHTCYPGPKLELAQARQEPSQAHQTKYQPQQPKSPQQQYPIPQPIIQEVFLGLGPEGELQIEPNEIENKAQIFRCFSFNTSLQETEPLDNYLLSYSPEFASPTTSDSNYFPSSPFGVNGPSVRLNVQTSESEMNDSNSGQNSVNNSPKMDDFEFALDQWLELDPNLF